MDRLMQLALQYGQGKLTEASLAKAREVLGLSSPLSNTDAGIYGLPQSNFQKLKSSFNPMRMIANQGIKSLMGGGKMAGMIGPGLLMGGALGLGYLTNPLRKGSRNYNPELQGQIDYASGRGLIDRNNSMGALRYNEDSVLSGQNVISGFGTNDYGKQLQKYRDKYSDTMPKERLEQLDREIFDQITDDFDKVDEYMETIAPAAPAPVYTPRDEGGGGGGGGGNPTGSPGSKGPGGSDEMGSFARGGIAGINRNRGQLGEILYG